MKIHGMIGKPRHAHWVVVASGALLGAAAIYAAGCTPTCGELLTCQTSGGSGSGGAESASSGSGGGAGYINCDPTIGKEVSNSCGVWAAPDGSDPDDMHPQATTLGQAVDMISTRTQGQPKNIYACFGTFKETITLPGGVTLWGALDCVHYWYWDPANAKTVLTPPDAMPDSIPLTVKNDPNDQSSAAVVDFVITAVPATVPGGSSIAVLVDTATATFTRCDLSAGDAMAGADGASGGAAIGATPGMNGGNGADAGAGSAIGGASGTNTCDSTNLAGGEGGAGAPSGSANQGGSGDGAVGASGGHGDMGSGCADGEDGSEGDRNQPLFSGAAGAGIGTITMSGYAGADGDHGDMGHYGTSGGGGGGTKATATASGGGGGGGGAGGCGGVRGEGGQAGGSSIALASLNANVTMNDCTLKAGTGGNGGTGGIGQTGQLGGSSGKGGKVSNGPPGCAGGKGGNGGTGSNGGDGHGGHSLGIAMKNGKLSMPMPPTSVGAPGTGGLAKDCWDFTTLPDGSECVLSVEPPG